MFAVRRRQRGCVAALLLLVAACGIAPTKTGEIGAVEGFLGAAISEEPRAALVARDTLSAGGSAADAAVAAYFFYDGHLPCRGRAGWRRGVSLL